MVSDENGVPMWGHELSETVRRYRYFSGLLTMVTDENNGVAWVDENGNDRYSYAWSALEQERDDAALRFAREVLLAAGAQRVLPSSQSSTHVQGGCRMGSDPQRSVLDAHGESHDVRRLFVGDGSAVPCTLSVNPSLTIMSLASRLAAYLSSRRARVLRSPLGQLRAGRRVRIAIAGAGGGVGASVAFNLLTGPLDCDVVMADSRPSMLRSHLWDLEQVLEQRTTGTVREGALSDLASADVVVMAASAPLTVNESRMVYLADNARILAPLLDALRDGWTGVLIVVTNPVDPLCTWALRRTGLDRRQVLGYTLNDSLAPADRHRQAAPRRPRLGRRLDARRARRGGGSAAVSRAHQRKAGESRRARGGRRAPVAERLVRAPRRTRLPPTPGHRHGPRGWGSRGWWAPLAGGDDELWTASVMLEGEYGIDGVSLSVPVRLGTGGHAGDRRVAARRRRARRASGGRAHRRRGRADAG